MTMAADQPSLPHADCQTSANKEAEEEECVRLRAKYDQLARQNDSDLSTLTSRVIASKQALAQERSGEIASTCEYCSVVISRYEKGEKGSYDYTSLCLVLA
jgi:hypothetical protein